MSFTIINDLLDDCFHGHKQKNILQVECSWRGLNPFKPIKVSGCSILKHLF